MNSPHMTRPMTRRRATTIGLTACLLWSVFALLAVLTAPVPPLLLNAITFAIGGAVGLVWTLARGRLALLRAVSWRIYAMGTMAVFGYHALYFTALRIGPPTQVMLVNYLWPLLIVLGSSFLPGERLQTGHVLGGLAAFAGAALVVAQGGAGFDAGALPAYALSVTTAVIWAGYSLISRGLSAVPTESVTVFCLGSAVLALALHLALETPAQPATAAGWAAILMLGLGPVGVAFFAWDIGMKHGDVQLLGVGSYAAPLLSTLSMVVAGVTEPTPVLLVAALLIALGAGIAARAGAGARRRASSGTA